MKKRIKNRNRLWTVRECMEYDWPPAIRRRLVKLLVLNQQAKRA